MTAPDMMHFPVIKELIFFIPDPAGTEEDDPSKGKHSRRSTAFVFPLMCLHSVVTGS